MQLASLMRHGLALLLLAQLGGCTLFDTTCDEDDADCLSAGLFAEGLGGKCKRTADCKQGLSCRQKKCVATGDTARGDKCRLTAECGDADYCGNKRVCQIAGITGEGGDCLTTGNCQHGLVCAPPDLDDAVLSLDTLASTSGACEDGGNREQGEPCDDVTDCLAGLTCFEYEGEKLCINPPPSDFELPPITIFWEGVGCEEVEDDDPTISYFEVPRSSNVDEFYRLPFPNDIRRGDDGTLDLSGHAMPPNTLGLPFVERYVEAAERDLDGFGTNAVAYFRFSHPYDFGTVNGSSVRIVDINPDSPDYNAEASVQWKVTEGPLSNYICPHWLGLRRPVHQPLLPGNTYVALVTTDIKPEDGGSYDRDEDLDDMLSSSAPSDSTMRDAWDRYQPLRDWIDDANIDADDILNAAVFTTQNAEARIAGLQAVVAQEPAPTVRDMVVCDDDTESPCEDDEGRGACRNASSDFAEIHGRIELPMFQRGTLPYQQPEDGGGFVIEDGLPEVQDHREVCFALSVPSADPPEGGYPVLIYAHGTGGSFTGQMGPGSFASVLANAEMPAALLAIDMPMHGDRRGDGEGSDGSPESLFFNFLNPAAARDNVLQGSADMMSLIEWVKQGGLSEGESPTGEPIPFDAARIALMGHSQGGTHTALMLSYAPDAIGTVLSGTGGHLASSLLTKTNPVDIAAVLPLGLLDPDDDFELAADAYNPALSMIQMVFDSADPINFARHIRRSPTELSPTGMHVMMVYGLNDTYSTAETLEAYARATRFTQVLPALEDISLPTEAAPLVDNAGVGGAARTIGMRQYAPVGDDTDGHFVGVREGEDGREDVERFLTGLLAGESPQIGE